MSKLLDRCHTNKVKLARWRHSCDFNSSVPSSGHNSSSSDSKHHRVMVFNHFSIMNTIQCDRWLHACVHTMLQTHTHTHIHAHRHTQQPHCSSRGGNKLYREAWRCQEAHKVPTVCVSVSVCWPSKTTLLSSLELGCRCGQSLVSLWLLMPYAQLGIRLYRTELNAASFSTREEMQNIKENGPELFMCW